MELSDASSGVLIPRLDHALSAKLCELLATPAHFGLVPENDTACLVNDVFRILLLDPNWRWISVGDVEEALQRVEFVSVVGDRVEIGSRNQINDQIPHAEREDDQELF